MKGKKWILPFGLILTYRLNMNIYVLILEICFVIVRYDGIYDDDNDLFF